MKVIDKTEETNRVIWLVLRDARRAKESQYFRDRQIGKQNLPRMKIKSIIVVAIIVGIIMEYVLIVEVL